MRDLNEVGKKPEMFNK